MQLQSQPVLVAKGIYSMETQPMTIEAYSLFTMEEKYKYGQVVGQTLGSVRL
jgi:hypothetical protein